MLRTFLITLLLYATTLTAFAQTTNPPPQIESSAVSTWPTPATAERLPQSNLDLVTTNQPRRRQRCHVQEIKADSITCTTKHHRPDITYRREEIIALIAPPAFQSLLGIVEAAGIFGATLAASFFVPFAWSLTLRILSGFLFYGGWAGNGEAQDKLSAVGYHDHARDILLYVRPNTTLAIHLHT